MQLQSTLTCPQCGHRASHAMPVDAYAFFHECVACHTVLRPLAGDCCVFCSYADVPCPPVQEAREQGVEPDCCIAPDPAGKSGQAAVRLAGKSG